MRWRPVALVVAATLVALAVPGTGSAFTATVTNSQDTGGAANRFTCADTFASRDLAPYAYFEYDLAGPSTSATETDRGAAGNTGTYQPGGSHPTGGQVARTPCPREVGGGAFFYAPDGVQNFISTTKPVPTAPTTFSIALWFRTTTPGGYVVGLAGGQVAANGGYDRHLYITTAGKMAFGTYGTGTQVIMTPSSVADGSGHFVVATMSPGTGMRLYVDGSLVASDATYTTAQANNNAYWRIGYRAMSGWPGNSSNSYFTGGLRYVAAYSILLSASEVAAQYRNGAP